ncbi:MAG TPA: thioredoxin domain-containing protein [Candidatus Saccharimonadales bacterium]|nr:thioredoxin domain-containing protein [Candidatus Saccharimonadales bacterium]
MSKQFLAILAAVIIVLIGVFALTNNKSSNGSKSSSGTPTNHVEGKGQAGVSLVEYGDYECPYCEQYYPIVKQVQAEFNDQITFQFRNFPLTSIHQNAFAGARAAEAAGLQGKFWQMHDTLYDNQDQWAQASDPTKYFNQYAQQLGLNLAQFQKDYSSTKVNDLINADMAAGNKLGVDATPTFYLDGKQINVSASVSSFETQIKNAIAQKSGKSSASSTPDTGTTSQSTAPKSSSSSQ